MQLYSWEGGHRRRHSSCDGAHHFFHSLRFYQRFSQYSTHASSSGYMELLQDDTPNGNVVSVWEM